ncbi:MAG: helix-turn-helix domain-containing protein [Candidatus Pacebacteria bacterium]|nr:helix-turn-helix domain-containing protein [Candidatus Paceibacterota bacterium]
MGEGEMMPIKNLLARKTIVLQGADLLSAKGFTQVPNHILESEKISPGAKLTYTMLLKYAWQNDFCFPGQDRLGKDMGVSRRSVNTYIQELEKKKFITIKRQGQGKPNIYTLKLTVDN